MYNQSHETPSCFTLSFFRIKNNRRKNTDDHSAQTMTANGTKKRKPYGKNGKVGTPAKKTSGETTISQTKSDKRAIPNAAASVPANATADAENRIYINKASSGDAAIDAKIPAGFTPSAANRNGATPI